MFGLGPGELLLLAAIIAIIGGPSAIKKVFGWVRTVQNARSQLTSKALLDRMLDDEPKKKSKRSTSKKRPK